LDQAKELFNPIGDLTMPFYAIVDVQVTDDSWIPDYAVNVHDIVHKHGGKYLSRSSNITTLEGEPSSANLIALIEFPTMEAVQTFCADPDYAPYGEARRAGSVSNFHVIDSTDTAGTIPYLEKGG
jgi:uncharacterized protein (DUF1330 family)